MFVLSLLSAHNVTSAYFKTTVTITNSLSGNLDLNVHCKSADDDLGPHLLHQGQSYDWSFGNKFFGGTLFFCTVQWNNEIHRFDAYDQDNDLLKCYKSIRNQDVTPQCFKVDVIHPPTIDDLPNIDSDTDIYFCMEGLEVGCEIYSNKAKELASLVSLCIETAAKEKHLFDQKQQTQLTPIQNLEQHLQEKASDQVQSSEPDHTLKQQSPEPQNTAERVQTSDHVHISPEHNTSEHHHSPTHTVELSPQSSQHTIPISQTFDSSPKPTTPSVPSTPESEKPQAGEPSLSQTRYHLSPSKFPSDPVQFDTSKFLQPAPPVSNSELAEMCNNILLRMHDLHRLRHSFVDLDEYMEAWEQLKKESDKVLSKVQNGDVNELIEFQMKTKKWVRGVNQEFDQAHMRRKGNFSISDNFFNEDVLRTEIWKENIDSELSMHLKFSLEPGPLFVTKDHVIPSELSAFEALKIEVNGKLASMKEEQEAMNARQAEMSADLKKILSLLSPKP
ncbi:unnamed protein product [Trifolium pratense]|uniref:Uncharacterized protein n=1 Tax=Trifolium pratense TaxID=57577 RepID=A0ACB0LBW5_TRIPR|nr:unnamed protein product [Trifolium pratense]